jgi:hypothetical protein
MLRNYRNDSIVSFLAARCSLTATQLDTIMVSQTEGKLGQMVSLRDKKKVSKGAFLRTLKQGQSNVEGALYTLLLLEYLGLVSSKQLFALGKIGDMLSKVQESSPDAESIGKLLRAMEELAVTFSRRRLITSA